MSEWTGGILSLSGVVIGGVVAYLSTVLQAIQQRHWEVVQHKRDKLEELSGVLDELEDAYRKITGAATHKLSTGNPMEFSASRIPTGRLNTLVEFYAPEMVELKNKLDLRTITYGEIMVEVIQNAGSNSVSRKELLTKVLQAHRDIESMCKQLSSKAAEIIKIEIENELSSGLGQRLMGVCLNLLSPLAKKNKE